MQQTYTVRGKRFSAKQIERLFDPGNMTNGEDFIIHLNGVKHFANYRQEQDQYFAPVCDRDDANCIALSPEGPQQYRPTVWMYWSA